MSARSGGEPAALPEWVVEALSHVDLAHLAQVLRSLALSEEFREGRGQPQFEAAVAASVAANLSSLGQLLSGRTSFEDVDPAQPIAVAVLDARLEISQASLHRGWRAAVETVWRSGIEAIRLHARRTGVQPVQVLDGVTAYTAVLERFHTHLVTMAASAHRREEEAMRTSREAFRRRAIRELLSGETTTLIDDRGDVLDYDVQCTHVTVLLSGTREDAARPVLAELGQALETAETLTFGLGLESTVCWLGRRGPWARSWRATVGQVLAGAGVQAAVSDPAAGVAGLRAGYRQARRVEEIRSLAAGGTLPAVLQFRDLRLEAQLLEDLGAAEAFVTGELGALRGSTRAHADLRKTVAVWLETRSVVESAQRLGLHEHSVRNRLRHAESLIGRQLTDRSAELQAALRLHRLLEPGVAAR